MRFLFALASASSDGSLITVADSESDIESPEPRGFMNCLRSLLACFAAPPPEPLLRGSVEAYFFERNFQISLKEALGVFEDARELEGGQLFFAVTARILPSLDSVLSVYESGGPESEIVKVKLASRFSMGTILRLREKCVQWVEKKSENSKDWKKIGKEGIKIFNSCLQDLRDLNNDTRGTSCCWF